MCRMHDRIETALIFNIASRRGHTVNANLPSGWARYITGHTLVVDGGGTLAGPPRSAGTEAALVRGHDG